ncbi:HdaA/DnaA family protein [Magnetospirillum gryphiswaldense]|uniref:HdaA/DnaA family protein n=1 Tax=Magnetospirillum gryphiswaldense TaxID=55518 RepID=UPI000D031F13|nr:DnaA/Hda family protein [Magnetospirillum gryphiswaldense]AVM74319.1 DnaA regulatory inactivator Hda [Magnetospirillum gryphiswaldense MSR-1]AVM78222.1 DnaA regulatory inactivator Hda [Magnetospirillum gryphiswaldense]
MTEGQLTLDLGHRPALGRDDFLVAPCNAEAVAWLERWPHWPHHALALFGPQGCGKTHLLAVFAQHHDLATIIIPASQLTADDSLHMQLPPVTMIDDLDDLVDETALFHLWNRTKEAGTHLLLAGRTAPARLPVHLPDLRSRLASLHAVGIGAPDESLLAAVLIKLFSDRQLRVGEDVVTYILGRAERSFATMGELVARLDRESLSRHKAVSIRMVRDALAGPDDRQGELTWI